MGVGNNNNFYPDSGLSVNQNFNNVGNTGQGRDFPGFTDNNQGYGNIPVVDSGVGTVDFDKSGYGIDVNNDFLSNQPSTVGSGNKFGRSTRNQDFVGNRKRSGFGPYQQDLAPQGFGAKDFNVNQLDDTPGYGVGFQGNKQGTFKDNIGVANTFNPYEQGVVNQGALSSNYDINNIVGEGKDSGIAYNSPSSNIYGVNGDNSFGAKDQSSNVFGGKGSASDFGGYSSNQGFSSKGSGGRNSFSKSGSNFGVNDNGNFGTYGQSFGNKGVVRDGPRNILVASPDQSLNNFDGKGQLNIGGFDKSGRQGLSNNFGRKGRAAGFDNSDYGINAQGTFDKGNERRIDNFYNTRQTLPNFARNNKAVGFDNSGYGFNKQAGFGKSNGNGFDSSGYGLNNQVAPINSVGKGSLNDGRFATYGQVFNGQGAVVSKDSNFGFTDNELNNLVGKGNGNAFANSGYNLNNQGLVGGKGDTTNVFGSANQGFGNRGAGFGAKRSVSADKFSGSSGYGLNKGISTINSNNNIFGDAAGKGYQNAFSNPDQSYVNLKGNNFNTNDGGFSISKGQGRGLGSLGKGNTFGTSNSYGNGNNFAIAGDNTYGNSLVGTGSSRLGVSGTGLKNAGHIGKGNKFDNSDLGGNQYRNTGFGENKFSNSGSFSSFNDGGSGFSSLGNKGVTRGKPGIGDLSKNVNGAFQDNLY